MARNPSDSKRRLEQSRFEDEEQEEKKRRVETSPLATSSQLVQSIHAEWSASDSTSSFKRHRSKSFEPPERNVRAKLSLDLSSSNPQPATFLMGAMANELDNIAQMFLSDASTSSSNRLGSQSSSWCSPTKSSSSSSSSTPQSSPDYYDRLVMRGHDLLERLRGDPELTKFFK